MQCSHMHSLSLTHTHTHTQTMHNYAQTGLQVTQPSWTVGSSPHMQAPALPCCRPLLHALVSPGVAAVYGVEMDEVKCQKALPFIKMVLDHLASSGMQLPPAKTPTILCYSAEQVRYWGTGRGRGLGRHGGSGPSGAMTPCICIGHVVYAGREYI